MIAKSDRSVGVILGVLGMLCFSGTLVATRIAVTDFTPFDITLARIVIAGLLGTIFLLFSKNKSYPKRNDILPLLIMALGTAVGYPLFLGLALETVPAVHGAVVTGLAPAATAIIAVLRAGESPRWTFWVACFTGFCAVLLFAYIEGGGHLSLADGWLILGMLCLGISYVEGGLVSQKLGALVAFCWAMVLLMPISTALLVWRAAMTDMTMVAFQSWVSLSYLGLFSMFIGSVFWYRGLALGGIARIGQINLLLPLMALLWAALILSEEISWTAAVCAVVILISMLVCLKSRS